MPLDLGETLAWTKTLVAEARERALALTAEGFRAGLKPDGSVVTSVDTTIERFLRAEIEARYPRHAILGEEYGWGEGSESGVPIWALDPIDGTTNLAGGLPLWSISVGLIVGDAAVLGVVSQPLLGETYAGARGLGATINDAPLPVLPPGGPLRWEDSYAVSSTCVREVSFASVPCRLRVFGSAALDLCWTAAGRTRGCQSIATSLYDVAAGICIAGEVGARTEWLNGQAWSPRGMAQTGPRSGVLLTAPPETLAFLRENLRQVITGREEPGQ